MFNKRNVLTIFLFLSLVMMCLSVAWASDDVNQSDSFDQSISDDVPYEIEDNKEVKIEETEDVTSQKLESTNTVSNYDELCELINTTNETTLNIVLEEGKNFTIDKKINLFNQKCQIINIIGNGNNINNTKYSSFLFNHFSTVTITNVTFSDIQIKDNFIINMGNLTITNSTIKNNYINDTFITNWGNCILDTLNINHNIIERDRHFFTNDPVNIFKMENCNITANKIRGSFGYSSPYELSDYDKCNMEFRNLSVSYNTLNNSFIYVLFQNITMENILFKKNSVKYAYVDFQTVHATINNVSFVDNSGNMHYYMFRNSNISMTNSMFFSNYQRLGSYLSTLNSSVDINNCQFKYNLQVPIIYLFYESGSYINITNSLFEKNEVEYLFLLNHQKCNIFINKSVFLNNTCDKELINSEADSLSVTCSKFKYNTIKKGALISSVKNMTLKFNTFLDNNSTLGDLSFYDEAYIYKNTFTNEHMRCGIGLVQCNNVIIRKNEINCNNVDLNFIYIETTNNTIIEYNTINVNNTNASNVIVIDYSMNTRIYSNDITSNSTKELVYVEDGNNSTKVYKNNIITPTLKGNEAVSGNGIIVYNNIPS